MKDINIAVVLSGCGHLDGAEIREAVLTLLALDKHGARVSVFAPDIQQHHVINHFTQTPMNESRNVLVEAARIARGNVQELGKAQAKNFDALILPGGFGAAKNLSDIAFKGSEGVAIPALKNLVLDFYNAQKPIGAICISPSVLAAALKGVCTPHLTLGEENQASLIEGLGGKHQTCPTRGIVIDDANHLVSTPAYMTEAPIAEVAAGIEKLVEVVLNQVVTQKKIA